MRHGTNGRGKGYRAKDLTGMRFGKLTAIRPTGARFSGQIVWELRCDCGNAVSYPMRRLISGKNKSCGCINESKKLHGLYQSKEYITWNSMLARCTNPAELNYGAYGGRGISVCQRWRDFRNFYADMGPKPEGLTLERKNNNLGYSPENCKWATRGEQARNTSRNVFVVVRGLRMVLKDAAITFGVSYRMACKHIKKGIKFEDFVQIVWLRKEMESLG